MKKYNVYETETMNDRRKTCTKVSILDNSTGEIFEKIGTATLHSEDSVFDKEYGCKLSFTRGYIGALKKAKKSVLETYKRIMSELKECEKQIDELNSRMIRAMRYEYDLLYNDVVETRYEYELLDNDVIETEYDFSIVDKEEEE